MEQAGFRGQGPVSRLGSWVLARCWQGVCSQACGGLALGIMDLQKANAVFDQEVRKVGGWFIFRLKDSKLWHGHCPKTCA